MSDKMIDSWRYEKRKSEPLRLSQIKLIRNAAKTHSFRAELIVALLIDTGIRVSDLINLEWSNVEWEERCLHFRQRKSKKLVRARIRRGTLRLLRNWKTVSKDIRIIPVTRGTIQYILKQIAISADLKRPLSPHDLCATAMSMAVWEDLPMKFAETQYGRSAKTIIKYYQKIPPKLQDKLFDEAFNNE